MRQQLFDTLRQLRLLLGSLTLRRLLLNRFTIVIVAALLLTGSVQAYADMNNEGTISGRVVDEDGDPVAGATVYIQRVNIRNQLGRVNTTTDENGYYEFTNQTRLLEFRLQAVKEGVGSSTVTRHHLYFRGQSSRIDIVIQSDADE
jgi:hypothetical protein